MKPIKSIMITLCVACLSALLILPVTASNSSRVNLYATNVNIKANEWMKSLNDTLLIRHLSLPGTHDSGAMWGGEALRTQSSTFSQQLETGIRAFDVRLQSHNGKLGVYHSTAFQHIFWEEDVLPTITSFLKNHPTEMLVVSLKCEGGSTNEYSSLLSASLQQTQYHPYIISSYTNKLTLGDCRGKILFLHRDEVGPDYHGARCEDWQDNASCLLNLRAPDGVISTVYLQDEYQYLSGDIAELKKKEKAIIHYFEQMSYPTINSSSWGISFISATGLPHGTPHLFANYLNRSIADYLINHPQRYCGIILIDFVASTEGLRLVNAIIRCNNW